MRTLALLLISAAAARSGEISLPLLPIHARLDASAPGFCSSSQLKDNLRGWAFGSVQRYGEYAPVTDLVVSCEPVDSERARIAVTDRDGKAVEDFKTRTSPSESDFDGIAFLVARRLAKGRKTIEAALVAHRANLRYSAAQRGAQALADGDYSTAADSLYSGLESDAEPAPLYYGLYVAHARLGDVLRARWYLLAFCESAGKRPDELSADQLRPLREMVRVAKSDDGFAAASMSEYRSLIASGRGAQAMFLMKNILKRAPWTWEGYAALADAYGKIAWGPLEDVWRARSKIARKAAKRKRNHEILLDIVDPS